MSLPPTPACLTAPRTPPSLPAQAPPRAATLPARFALPAPPPRRALSALAVRPTSPPAPRGFACRIWPLALLVSLALGSLTALAQQAATPAASKAALGKSPAVAAPAAPRAASAPVAGAPAIMPRRGYVVPIGGALKYDNAEVWARLVQLSGGAGARWVVVPLAAANPETTGARIAEALSAQGALAELLPVSPRWAGRDVAEAVQDAALAATVRRARGVFFAGGAQARITDALLQADGGRTPLLEAIWSVVDAGGVIAGTSAGAAVMSETMFRDAANVLGVLKAGRAEEGREIDRGLGFVGPELFIDQHFLKRGRIGRMLPLMLQKGYRLGLGVEENSAAILHGNQVEVIGGKGVLLVDLADATHDDGLGAFNLKNARLTYLDRGDRHDFATGTTTPSPQKLAGMSIDPNSPDFKPYFRRMPFVPDILGDAALVSAMGNLIDNHENEAFGLAFAGIPPQDDPQPDLGFEFRLRRLPESRGWYTGAFGGEDYTVLNLALDVTPVIMTRPLYQPLERPAAAKAAPALPPPAGPAREQQRPAN